MPGKVDDVLDICQNVNVESYMLFSSNRAFYANKVFRQPHPCSKNERIYRNVCGMIDVLFLKVGAETTLEITIGDGIGSGYVTSQTL